MKEFSFFSFAVVDKERSGKISLAACLERERVGSWVGGGETWVFLSEPHWHHYTDTVDAFIAVKQQQQNNNIVMSVKATTNKKQLSGKMTF